MKRISELGLELIELDDQVLLVDQQMTQPEKGLYVLDNRILYVNSSDKSILSKQKLLASTKPLEGLPLLVIEDYVNIPEFELELEKLRFQQGYDKTRQIFKFTEEDLRKAISMTRETLEWDEKWGWFTTKTEDEIIESITKNELWIEVELSQIKSSDKTGYTVERVIPKIIEGKIKALWK